MDDFDTPPTVFIPRTEFALTAPFVGRRSVLEQATPGRQLRSAGEGIGTRIVWIASPNDFTAAPPMLLYRCALNGWRVRRVVPVERPYPLEDRRDPGMMVHTHVEIDCDRIGAQVVDIDPVHGSGFREGGYYGGPGAWGGYGVRDSAGPWYRFTVERGLQPCPAEEAIAALTRSAARHCAGDRDFIAEIVSF